MYEDYKVYGPYKRKDGRQHVILKKDKIRITISYPKYLMECHIGRKLLENETIDHIDRNVNNNNFNNLRIIDKVKHEREDAIRNKDIKVKCGWCEKTFIIKGSNISQRNRYDGKRTGSGYFCSRICSGKYGKYVQETNNRKSKISKVKPTKYINKNGSMVELKDTADLSSATQ